MKSYQCHLYKLVHDLSIKFPNSPITTSSSDSYPTCSNHNLSLHVLLPHKYFIFFCDAIHTCNSLPYSVMSLPSLNKFKRQLLLCFYCVVFYFWVHTRIRTIKKTTAKKQFPRPVPRLVLVQLSLNIHCQCRHSHHLIGMLGRETILSWWGVQIYKACWQNV